MGRQSAPPSCRMRTRPPGLSGRPPSFQLPVVSTSDTVHWNVAPSPSRARTDWSSESTDTTRSGAESGSEAGRDGGTRPCPRHAPLPRSTRVSRGRRRVCNPRVHISTRPRQGLIPTAHGQADGPGASRPHRAAVAPGVQEAAAPQLEKAPRAEGLEPEPRAGGERSPVLGAGVAEGRGEFGWAPAAAAPGRQRCPLLMPSGFEVRLCLSVSSPLGSGRSAPAGCTGSLTGKMSPFGDIRAEKGCHEDRNPRVVYPSHRP